MMHRALRHLSSAWIRHVQHLHKQVSCIFMTRPLSLRLTRQNKRLRLNLVRKSPTHLTHPPIPLIEPTDSKAPQRMFSLGGGRQERAKTLQHVTVK